MNPPLEIRWRAEVCTEQSTHMPSLTISPPVHQQDTQCLSSGETKSKKAQTEDEWGEQGEAELETGKLSKEHV